MEDRHAVMQAPLVDLAGKFPAEIGACLGEHIKGGARALLVDPEEQETRVFALYDDRLEELGLCDVSDHQELLRRIAACRGGAVEVDGQRYLLELTTSFSDFGDRLSVQFFAEGRCDAEELLERRRENIRLVNRLKPATSLTRKNELDIAAVVEANPREPTFPRVLVEDGLLEEKDLQDYQGDLLSLLQAHVFPRKAMASALARYLGVEYVDVEEVAFSKPACRRLDREWSLQHQVVPYAEEGGVLKVAMMDPTDGDLIEEIERRTGLKVEASLSAAQDIMVMIHKGHKDD